MKQRVFGCRKFKRLSYEQLDRDLKPSEIRFQERHRSVCRSCERTAEQGLIALSMLRDSALEHVPDANFDERVLRKLKVAQVRSGFQYWSPAMIGAAVASVVLLAALQMIAQPSNLPTIKMPGGSAFRYSSPQLPELTNISKETRQVDR